MSQDSLIVFVCEHGAAKSVIAAAYFNKLARERALSLFAIARGTHPDQSLSPAAIVGLHEDGLIPTESMPRILSLAEVESAQQIITFCELPDEYLNRVVVEQWDGIPPVSEDYEKARNAIIQKIDQLINRIA